MNPHVEFLGCTSLDGGFLEGNDPTALIEYSGRVDYGPKSLSKFGDPDIIKRWIDSGHQSMIEMVDVAFLITCTRVVSHEIVRHRIASYQQESQRYVKYDEETEEELFFLPDYSDEERANSLLFSEAYHSALESYKRLRKAGIPAQTARYVLPNGTRTRIVMKANLREWRHFIALRFHPSAQPEMQEIAEQIYNHLSAMFPSIFSDLPLKTGHEVR